MCLLYFVLYCVYRQIRLYGQIRCVIDSFLFLTHVHFSANCLVWSVLLMLLTLLTHCYYCTKSAQRLFQIYRWWFSPCFTSLSTDSRILESKCYTSNFTEPYNFKVISFLNLIHIYSYFREFDLICKWARTLLKICYLLLGWFIQNILMSARESHRDYIYGNTGPVN